MISSEDLPPLVQRQERRALPNPASPNSIDSWDFATTVNSPPGTSTFRHSTLQRLVAEEEETGTSNWQRKKQNRSLLDPPSSAEHPEFDYGTDNEGEDDKRSAEASSSTASDTRSLTDSSGSPDGGVSTAPSSYVASSPIAIKGKHGLTVPVNESDSTSSSATDEHPLSQSLPSPHATVISRHSRPLPSHVTAPALATMFAPSEPLTKVQSAASESDLKGQDSSKRARLWKKLTNNLKPSKNGDAPQEKSKLGELISSAGRNTIGKVRRGSSSLGSDGKQAP